MFVSPPPVVSEYFACCSATLKICAAKETVKLATFCHPPLGGLLHYAAVHTLSWEALVHSCESIHTLTLGRVGDTPAVGTTEVERPLHAIAAVE